MCLRLYGKISQTAYPSPSLPSDPAHPANVAMICYLAPGRRVVRSPSFRAAAEFRSRPGAKPRRSADPFPPHDRLLTPFQGTRAASRSRFSCPSCLITLACYPIDGETEVTKSPCRLRFLPPNPEAKEREYAHLHSAYVRVRTLPDYLGTLRARLLA